MRYTHPFKPIFNKDSRILVLGSFPSIISREQEFYYSHLRNRFWKILESLFEASLTNATLKQKIKFLLDSKIALWDIVKSCEIKGSLDSNLKNALPNDLHTILDNANIKFIFCNGALAYRLTRHFYPQFSTLKQGTGHSLSDLATLKNALSSKTTNNLANSKITLYPLPSSSPANARYSLESLLESWAVIKESLR